MEPLPFSAMTFPPPQHLVWRPVYFVVSYSSLSAPGTSKPKMVCKRPIERPMGLLIISYSCTVPLRKLVWRTLLPHAACSQRPYFFHGHCHGSACLHPGPRPQGDQNSNISVPGAIIIADVYCAVTMC